MRFLIAHAPHAPGRPRALARLLEQLPPGVEVLSSRGPEHAAIWARRLWERAATTDEHVCLLNDDVRVAEDIVGRLARAVEAAPGEAISLHCTNPRVAGITGAWARCYHYSGPGVVLPPGAARSLLEYTYTLPWSYLSRVNEDVIAIAWAWSRQRPFWYLLPSPIAHDTSVPSTLGHDAQSHRTPIVEGPERDPAVADRDAVPFVELDWSDTRALRYRREVLRAGRHLCVLCVGREGVVGSQGQGVMLCTTCLAELTSTALRGRG